MAITRSSKKLLRKRKRPSHGSKFKYSQATTKKRQGVALVAKKPTQSNEGFVLGPTRESPIRVQLAKTYNQSQTDPTGWMMSEKLDGYRAFWNGEKMYSRNGNQFSVPQWFTKNLPKCQLDGEIFAGRGQFSKVASYVRKPFLKFKNTKPVDNEWNQLTYQIFDAPGIPNKSFSERYQLMEKVFSENESPYSCLVKQIPCKGKAHLDQFLKEITDKDGEGVMIKHPKSKYDFTRSSYLQKVKVFHDAEAKIIGYNGYGGQLKSYICKNGKNGRGATFNCGGGLSMEQRARQNWFKKGTVITYKYFEIIKKSGKPRFPTFLRLYKPT